MPSSCQPSFLCNYLDILGAIEGFVDSHQCDVIVIVGDFNVDFSRDSAFVHLLSSFMSSLGLIACDLAFHRCIQFTYERDDGAVRSWIDHILCSTSHSHLITHVCLVSSGVTLSDHLPISFDLAVNSVFGYFSSFYCFVRRLSTSV